MAGSITLDVASGITLTYGGAAFNLGANVFAFSGAGTLANGSNTVTLNAAASEFQFDTADGTVSGNIALAGGFLDVNENTTISGLITVLADSDIDIAEFKTLTYSNATPIALTNGLSFDEKGSFAGDIALGASGILDINEDMTFTSAADISMSGNGTIDIAAGTEFVYSGAEIDVDANTLTFDCANSCTFTNSNEIDLDNTSSVLSLEGATGTGTINRVSVSAADATIQVPDVADYIINYLTLSADTIINATGANLEIAQSLTTVTNAVELDLSGSTQTVTVHDIILFSDLDIDGTITLSGDSTLYAKESVTFGAGSDLTFEDGVVVDDGKTLTINDSDVGVAPEVTFEGGVTITSTGEIVLDGDDDLTFQNPTPDADTMDKISQAGGATGTLTPAQAITGFTAEANATSGEIQLTWTNSAPVYVYICRSTLGYLSVPCPSGAIYNSNGVSYLDDSGLTDGVTYFYTAFSYEGGPLTPPTTVLATSQASAAPADGATYTDVSDFTAQPRDSKIILSWNNPDGGTSPFASTRIKRSTSGFPTDCDDASGDTVYDGSSDTTADTYTDTGLRNGTIYFYRAFAINSSSPVHPVSIRSQQPPSFQPAWSATIH